MRRRAFITAARRRGDRAFAAWPLAARAQQPAARLIGMLHSQTQGSEATRMPAIEQGRSEAGFVAGRNVRIEHRYADGHNDRLPMLAAELARLPIDVIFANPRPRSRPRPRPRRFPSSSSPASIRSRWASSRA